MNGAVETLKIDALSKNLKKHFHDDCSVTVLLKGMCRAWIDGSEHSMKAGDALIVSPGVVHSCEPVQGTESVSYIVFSITASHVENFFMDSALYAKFTSRAYKIINIMAGNEKILCSDPANLKSGKTISDYLLSDILHCASGTFRCRTEKKRNLSANGPEIAADYLKNNYMKDLSLDELAEIAGLSKYYLIHSFKKKFRLTPYSYMTNLRINSARILLRGNETLCRIALELGFYDQSHFTNTFAQYTGISPQNYRNFFQQQQ